MKKHKSQIIVRNLIILVLIASCYVVNAQVYINGPAGIVPGEATQYFWSHFGYSNPTWSAQFATFSSSSVTNPYITISKNVTTPSIQLQVVSKDVSNPTQTLTEYKNVEVYPFINGPTTISPGQSITLTNQDNRAGLAGHNACYWEWSASDLSALTCQGNCNNSGSNSVVFTCPTTAPRTFYTISCTKKCGAGAFAYTSQIRVDVSNSNPGNPGQPTLPAPIIDGPREISCDASLSNLVYSVNNLPQASYYEWEIPSGWVISGDNHTNSISVANFGNSGGLIKVYAYDARGGGSKSEMSAEISCCPQLVTVTTPVSRGGVDHRQANYCILASNTINNGATAKYHGGTFVNLLAGFSAMAESNVHIYPEICTSTYQRVNNSDNNDTVDNSAAYDMRGSESNLDLLENDEFLLKIFPNPTDGSFKLMFDKTKGLPEIISLRDVLGKEVKTIFKPAQYEYDFDIKDLDQGIYIIHVYYSDKTLSKKIIKN